MNKIGFLIFFSIYALLNFYIFLRGRQALPKELFIQIIYTIVFLAFSCSMIIAFTLEGKVHPVVITLAENLGGFWMISLLYFLAVVLLADILRLTNHFFGIFPDVVKANYPLAKLYYSGAMMLILVVFSIIGYVRFTHPATVELNLDIPKNGHHLKNVNIVAVSDVHLGDVIRKSRLRQYVNKINSFKPDLILIAGDLFDRNLHAVERQKMDEDLRQLKARYGVYAILGNHEYYGNLSRAAEIISNSGIKLLRDSAVTIDSSFVLIGRDDLTNRKRKPLKELVAATDKMLPSVLLDHQPAHLNEAEENNIDLQISGHTHNGQIFPINKIVARIYEVAHGYKKKGNTNIYVSSGLGLWGAPIRLGTQSEILKIRLNFTGK